jgi:hypothetical protein
MELHHTPADHIRSCGYSLTDPQVRHEGHVKAGGVDKDAAFVDADPALNDQIDAAYRAKYRRYGAQHVDPVVAPEARSATIKLVPRSASS